jgi:hypothetical protein
MEVAVANQTISGEAQGNGFIMSVIGSLASDGAVLEGVFRRDNRAAAIMTGTFLTNDAAGRWQGTSCEGRWSLRHTRR